MFCRTTYAFALTYHLIESRWEVTFLQTTSTQKRIPEKFIQIRVTNNAERIVSKSYEKQNVGSATAFREKLKIQKTNIRTNKIMCGIAKPPFKDFKSRNGKMEYLQV